MEIKVAWWNTSMSPPLRRKDRTRKQPTIFLAVLRKLMRNGVNLLGLGEVDGIDIQNIKAVLAETEFKNFKIVELLDYDRRLQHLALIYDSLVFPTVGDEAYVAPPKRKSVYYRAGVRVPVTTVSGEIFNIYLSHWQCRRTYPTSAERRGLGELLRGSIETIFEKNEEAHIIVMGDFNDEPYSESMVYGLQSGRDKHHFVAVKDKQVLYNPFWRVMGGVHPYENGVVSNKNTPSGTCYFRHKVEYTDWKTLDQILFSTSFIGASKWHLIEKETRIYSMLELNAVVTNLLDASDHLPVQCLIRRV